MGAKSKSGGKGGVPVARYPIQRLQAKDRLASDPKYLLTEPNPTTDDFVQDCLEKSVKMTVCADLCTTANNFSEANLKVHMCGWAIPHLLKVSAYELVDDPRGAIVSLKETQVSFKNLLKEEIILHANTPVAKINSPDSIFARASGFRKGNTMTDDVVLKAGETLTYTIQWDKMKTNVPITTVMSTMNENERLWMNMLCFCVEIKTVDPNTGLAYPANQEVVSLIPKARYSKRKSNPIPLSDAEGKTMSIGMQGTENFGFATLEGIRDLYTVNPVDAMGGGLLTKEYNSRYVRDNIMFSTRPGRVLYCQDAYNEGDLLGVGGHNLGDYTTAQLMVKRSKDNAFFPLQLPSRQADNIRVMVPGLCLSSDDRDPAYSYSYFKFVRKEGEEEGAWLLWDEDASEPRQVDPGLGIETTVSAFTPLMVVEGLNSPKAEVFQGFYSVYGQPYGDPKGFMEFLKTTISVINVISKVATFVEGLI